MWIKFSRAGRVKCWVLKRVLGIDLLELIFGANLKWEEEIAMLEGVK